MRRVLPCGAPLRAMVRRWTSCSSQDWVGARVVHSHSRASFSRRNIHAGKMVRNTRANDSDESDQASNAIDDVCDDVQADMWRKLYERDYSEKARIARFLTSAIDLIEERKANRNDRSPDLRPNDASESFMIAGKEHGGYELPAQALTVEVIHEMVANFSDGQRLRSASLKRLLDEGQAILVACPNISLIPAGTKVTVVGDIHGSLEDLLNVFELVGWPDEENTFVFNGDFVDRGESGVEVVAVLLALKICCPGFVHLNRGNHEDSNIGRAYGFFEEVMVKYGSRQLYDRIGQVFCHLPLCAVLENEVFIVHAGIPSDEAATIYHIGAVARSNITSTVAAKWASSRAAGSATSRPRSLGLVEDLLWSDPVNPADEPGSENMSERNMIRGAGCRYGPNLVQRWLKKMNCYTLVRSHECVEAGWSYMDCGANTQMYTVFSNANYQGGGNRAAVLIFPGDGLAEPDIVTWHSNVDARASLGTSNRKQMVDLICRHKRRLREHLIRLSDGHDWISVEDWNSAMRTALALDVDFTPFCKTLAPVHEDRVIHIQNFLDRYVVQVRMGRSEDSEGTLVSADEGLSALLMDKREILLGVFGFFDNNGDGLLSKDEVVAGCSLLNERLSPDEQLDPEQIFSFIDVDGGGSISVAEFCRIWASEI